MRIVQVITSLRLGGAERFVSDIVPLLKRRGMACDVIVLDGSPTSLTSELQQSGIEVKSLSYGEKAMRNPLLVMKLRNVIRGYDIVHSHNTSCQFMVALAKHKGQITVTTEHNTYNRRREYPLLRRIDSQMYSCYSKIVCVSNAVSDGLLSWIGPQFKDRMVTICNGINLNRFTSNSNRRDYVGNPEKRTIVMVAGFRPSKDHVTAIEALSRLPENFNMIFVGTGETENECKRLVERCNLSERVKFMGESKDVASIIGMSDISILPTHNEGQPLVAIETMACGVPLIATDIDSVRETVDGAAMLVRPSNSSDLAEAIQKVCDDRKLWTELSDKGIVQARRYDIEHTSDAHFNLYNSLLQ